MNTLNYEKLIQYHVSYSNNFLYRHFCNVNTIVEKIRFNSFHVYFKLHGEGHYPLFNNSIEISSTCCQNIIKFVKSVRNFGRNCDINVLYNTPSVKIHDKMSTRHSFGGELQ